MRVLILCFAVLLSGCFEPKASDLSYADLVPATDSNGNVTFTFMITDKYMKEHGGRDSAIAKALPYYINFRKICSDGYTITGEQKLPTKPHHEIFGICK